MKDNQELQKVIEEQREQIKKLDNDLYKLELRVTNDERDTKRAEKELKEVRKIVYMNFWIALIILACVIILLGSE